MRGQYYNGFSRTGCQREELGWFGSGQVLLESPCECGIKPPSLISHGVS